MNGKILVGGIVGFIACSTALMLLSFRRMGSAPIPPIPFEAKLWLAERESSAIEGNRLRMVAYLESRLLPTGMPREHTRKLLGEPDAASDKDRASHRDVYTLGYRKMRVDPAMLVLQFDPQGRLKEHYQQEF